MGNQEAKQKRAAAASSNGSYPSLDEGWKEGGGDAAKKGARKLGKHGGKGANSSGGGGVMHGTGTGKKKSKSEAKSSVFSIRKRKSNLKEKRDACSSVTGSKEDVLLSQHEDLDNTKTLDVSADEPGESDAEAAVPDKRKKTYAKKDGSRDTEMQWKTSTTAASPTDDGGQKGGSSGSDTDIYSFHSAADHEDLLADIQLAIRLQHQHGGVNSGVEPQKGEEKNLSWGPGEGRKQSNGVVKLTPPEVLDLTPELELGSDALSFLETGTPSSSVKHIEHLATLKLPSDTEAHEKEDEKDEKEVDHPEFKEEGQREKEREATLCVAGGTIDQHAWLQQPPRIAIAMATAGGVALSPVTMTTTGNSVPELTFESNGKTSQDGGEEGDEIQQDERKPATDVDLIPPSEESCETTAKPVERFSGPVIEEGAFRSGLGTSAESLEDSLSADSESSHSAAVCPFGERCRRSSLCFTPLPSQESPTTKRLLMSTRSSSSPVVKPYPPIFPSYIKTTTRQLSSPGQSPAPSPSHSPCSLRRAQYYLHRYLWHHSSAFVLHLAYWDTSTSLRALKT